MKKSRAMTKDKQNKAKGKKTVQNIEGASGANDAETLANHSEEDGDMEVDLKTIFREIKEFRQDNKKEFQELKEDINRANKRLDETEERITTMEDRMQVTEEVMTEMIKLHGQLEAKLIDQEGRDRRNNIRIYSVPEGSEKNHSSMTSFIEQLLTENLKLPTDMNLQIERAHRALTPLPPSGSAPRSIIVRFLEYRTKEEIIKTAWQNKGFVWKGKQINFDHDYASGVLKKRREYAEVKKILKEKGIRFQTPFPARMRVFYEDGVCMYNSAIEATRDMAERGLPVAVVKQPETLMEKIQKMTWSTSDRRGRSSNRRERRRRADQSVVEKLQQFRRESAE